MPMLTPLAKEYAKMLRKDAIREIHDWAVTAAKACENEQMDRTTVGAYRTNAEYRFAHGTDAEDFRKLAKALFQVMGDAK